MLKYQFTETSFSERPSYDPKVVEAVFSKYCTAATVHAEKTIRKGGINVAKRKDAILKSLYTGNTPVQTFGELELGLFNNNI